MILSNRKTDTKNMRFKLNFQEMGLPGNKNPQDLVMQSFLDQAEVFLFHFMTCKEEIHVP